MSPLNTGTFEAAGEIKLYHALYILIQTVKSILHLTTYMQEKVLCYWVNYRDCRFKEFRNTMPKHRFLKEYCTHCLQGQLIEIIFDLTHKFDNI